MLPRLSQSTALPGAACSPARTAASASSKRPRRRAARPSAFTPETPAVAAVGLPLENLVVGGGPVPLAHLHHRLQQRPLGERQQRGALSHRQRQHEQKRGPRGRETAGRHPEVRPEQQPGHDDPPPGRKTDECRHGQRAPGEHRADARRAEAHRLADVVNQPRGGGHPGYRDGNREKEGEPADQRPEQVGAQPDLQAKAAPDGARAIRELLPDRHGIERVAAKCQHAPPSRTPAVRPAPDDGPTRGPWPPGRSPGSPSAARLRARERCRIREGCARRGPGPAPRETATAAALSRVRRSGGTSPAQTRSTRNRRGRRRRVRPTPPVKG